MEWVLCFVLFGFGFAHDFYEFCFCSAQADFVVHYFIFYGVAQWCIEQDLDGLSLYEAHFDDSLAESAVSVYSDYDSRLSVLKF